MNVLLPKILLVLEASTATGSLALFVDGVLATAREFTMGPSRDDAMLPAIAASLRDGGLKPSDISAIACGSGPGSFTSLRIAASISKGIAVANDALLYAVPSLLLAFAAEQRSAGEYLLHSDALRGDRYVQRISVRDDGTLDVIGTTLRMSFALIEEATATGASAASVLAVGPVRTGDAHSVTLVPRAQDVAGLFPLWNSFGPRDVAQWEPDYGRLAEAQVKWETTHGQSLPTS